MIFDFMTSLAGYLCATVHAPRPHIMVRQLLLIQYYFHRCVAHLPRRLILSFFLFHSKSCPPLTMARKQYHEI
jgi:hypothetical protein